MDKKNVVFKCYSSGDGENDVLYYKSYYDKIGENR